MTVGRLNALLDDLRDASSKKPGLNTPAKDSPMDKGRRKAPQESAKGRYLRSIVTRVDQSELQFVLNVILKDDKGHAVGGCETFMKHVHQDAGAVMDTCVIYHLYHNVPTLFCSERRDTGAVAPSCCMQKDNAP